MQKTEKNQIQKQIKMIWIVTLFLGVFYMWAPIMMPEALCAMCFYMEVETWYFYAIWVVQLVIAIVMYCSRNMYKRNEKKFLIWISILAIMYFIVALIPAVLYACLPVMNGHSFEFMLDLRCKATIMFWGAVIDLGMTLVCGSILTKTICLYGKQLKIMIRSALVICVIVVTVMILGDYEFSSVRNILGDNKPITGFATMGWLCYVQAGITLVLCCIMMNISRKTCAIIGMVFAGINIMFALFHYGMLLEPSLSFGVDELLETYSSISYHYKPNESNEVIAKMLNLVLVELSGLVIVWCKNYLVNKHILHEEMVMETNGVAVGENMSKVSAETTGERMSETSEVTANERMSETSEVTADERMSETSEVTANERMSETSNATASERVSDEKIQETGEKLILSKKLVKSVTLISIVQMIACVVIILGMIYLCSINVEKAWNGCEECDVEDTAIIEYRVAAIAVIVQLVVAIRIVLAVLKDKWNKHCEQGQLLQSCKKNSKIGAISMVILAIMAVIAPAGEETCIYDSYLYYTYVKEAKIIIGIISLILLCLNLIILYLTSSKNEVSK